MINCFRYSIKNKNYYIVTNKKISNKTDAKKILDLFAEENNIQTNNYNRQIIENTINTIKSHMTKCDVKVNKSELSFTEKFGGGAGEKIIRYTINKFYITE